VHLRYGAWILKTLERTRPANDCPFRISFARSAQRPTRPERIRNVNLFPITHSNHTVSIPTQSSNLCPGSSVQKRRRSSIVSIIASSFTFVSFAVLLPAIRTQRRCGVLSYMSLPKLRVYWSWLVSQCCFTHHRIGCECSPKVDLSALPRVFYTS